MPREKPVSEKPTPASKNPEMTTHDHEYAMEVSSLSTKRKTPVTPTKPSVPPNKVVVSNKSDAELSALTAAIEKLTARFDDFDGRLRENSVILANLTKITEVNAADIKDCKSKVHNLGKEVSVLRKENDDLRERVVEMERYKRRWNLKLQGLKEKTEENTRKEVLEILAKMAPQHTSVLEMVVDTVHRLGRKETGRHRQIIIQFSMRHYRDIFWKVSKDARVCQEMGIFFKQDFCKADREARAAVWPKMEKARAAVQNVYYRGHIGYANGVRLSPD
ncbi:uncharacterized protein LOC144989330 [Oryzias latipes]